MQVGLPPGQRTVISALQNIKEPREECFVMQSHSPWTDARVQHSHRRDMAAVGVAEAVGRGATEIFINDAIYSFHLAPNTRSG